MPYTYKGLQTVIVNLRAWADSAQASLEVEEGKENPNDERVDKYTARVEALESAASSLEEIKE
mgnify:CR=1 FL=1